MEKFKNILNFKVIFKVNFLKILKKTAFFKKKKFYI